MTNTVYCPPNVDCPCYAALTAENERLRAENERMRATLEPFAKAADGFDRSPIKNPEDVFAYAGVRGSDGDVGAITVGDLRRARAALEVKP
jgi:hypothetical protein